MYEPGDMLQSVSEVESLIVRMALEAGFNEVRTSYVSAFGVSSPSYKDDTDKKWHFRLNRDTLYISNENIDRLTSIYEISSDIAYDIIDYIIMWHEPNHLKGYSVDKIRAKHTDLAIEKYGSEKFYSLCERDQKRFIRDVLKSGPYKQEKESQANVQAVISQLESDIDRERIMEKIAASIWYIRGWDCSILHCERDEKLKDDVKGYLEWYFPQEAFDRMLKTKEDVVGKALEIDRKFREKLSTGHSASLGNILTL